MSRTQWIALVEQHHSQQSMSYKPAQIIMTYNAKPGRTEQTSGQSYGGLLPDVELTADIITTSGLRI